MDVKWMIAPVSSQVTAMIMLALSIYCAVYFSALSYHYVENSSRRYAGCLENHTAHRLRGRWSLL